MPTGDDEGHARSSASRLDALSAGVRRRLEPCAMADHRIDKWTGWIDGRIKTNVLTMHLHRDAWGKVTNILQKNGQLPDSYWWEFRSTRT
jgi:hypothetical protein